MSLIASSGGVSRIPANWYGAAGGVSRKLQSIYGSSGGANRKLFNRGIKYSSCFYYQDGDDYGNMGGVGLPETGFYGSSGFYANALMCGWYLTFENAKPIEVDSIKLSGFFSTWKINGTITYPQLTDAVIHVFDKSTSTQIGAWSSNIPNQLGDYSFADAIINLSKSVILTNLRLQIYVGINNYFPPSANTCWLYFTIPNGGIILQPSNDGILLN
jgi:hypothetical protein